MVVQPEPWENPMGAWFNENLSYAALDKLKKLQKAEEELAELEHAAKSINRQLSDQLDSVQTLCGFATGHDFEESDQCHRCGFYHDDTDREA